MLKGNCGAYYEIGNWLVQNSEGNFRWAGIYRISTVQSIDLVLKPMEASIIDPRGDEEMH